MIAAFWAFFAQAEPTDADDPEAIVVQGLKADERAPIANTELDRAEISARDHGDEIPFLLAQTPSVQVWSDSGSGSGYSYFSIRGIHQNRSNITLDGIPLNDGEDLGTYFSNIAGFTGMIDNLQLQRGTGSSAVGAPSFVGAVHFESLAPAHEPQATIRGSVGSYGTLHGSLVAHSGELPHGFRFVGQLAMQDTDGYRDHSFVRQLSSFVNIVHESPNDELRLMGIFGREKSGLAFYASDAATLGTDPRNNPLDEAEVDAFGQDIVQLEWKRRLSDHTKMRASLYYNGGQGFYRLWADPSTQLDLLEFQLDGQAIGGLLTFEVNKGPVTYIQGVNGNVFWREHALDLHGAQLYENTGYKTDASEFSRVQVDAGKVHPYAEIQLRHASFSYRGDPEIEAVQWLFVNPKLGAKAFFARDRLAVWGSAGLGSREPGRSDLFLGEDQPSIAHDLRAIHPERVVDLELGLDVRLPNEGEAKLGLYAVEFWNEIAATGELTEMGLYKRKNVGRSFRRGVELEAKAPIGSFVTLRHASAFSWNRIGSWTQTYDVFGESGEYLGAEARTYEGVQPLLTPNWTVQQAVLITPTSFIGVEGSVRAVGASYLDNTNQPDLVAPAWFQIDANAWLDASKWTRLRTTRLSLSIDNLADRTTVWPSGYSWSWLQQDSSGESTVNGIPYYYPLAGRRVMFGIELGV